MKKFWIISVVFNNVTTYLRDYDIDMMKKGHSPDFKWIENKNEVERFEDIETAVEVYKAVCLTHKNCSLTYLEDW